jgi:hypothetical protein
MRVARVCAGIGVVLFTLVIWHASAVAVGAVEQVNAGAWYLLGLSVLLISTSAAYAGGWYAGRDHTVRALRRQWAAAVASVPQAAVRQDASLPAPRLADADTQVIERVDPRVCIRGREAERRRDAGLPACMWCPHAAHDSIGWEIVAGTLGLCPCCRRSVAR